MDLKTASHSNRPAEKQSNFGSKYSNNRVNLLLIITFAYSESTCWKIIE